MDDFINKRGNKIKIRFNYQSEQLFFNLSCVDTFCCNPRLDTSDVIRLTVRCLISEVSSALSTITSNLNWPILKVNFTVGTV